MEYLKNLGKEFYDNFIATTENISDNDLESVIKIILDAPKVFVLGIGHSGMFGRILSMKLRHVGVEAYTVFDEINPPFKKNDLFIAISQSGNTSTIVTLAEKAKKLGGRVIGITSNDKSSLTEISDAYLKIGKIDNKLNFDILGTLGVKNNQNLLGSLFGFNIYILFYLIVIMIAKKRGETAEEINSRHATLQ